MFGIYRTLLALLVVTTHLYGLFYNGIYAVFGFYMLSGYLMTTIMHDTYGYTIQGGIKYITNRFLRIFPSYWVAIIITIVLIYIFGEDALSGYQRLMYLPRTPEEILRNIFLIFDKETSSPRLSPATWALTVEIFFYIMICLGISKTKHRTGMWVTLSIIYNMVAIFYIKKNLASLTYSSIMAGSLPFSLGSFLFYLAKERKFESFFKSTILLRPEILTAVMFLNMSIFTIFYRKDLPIKSYGFTYGFYINLAIVFTLTLSLIYYNGYAKTSNSHDKAIGRLSYPIYLLHWQIGFITSILVVGRPFHGFSTKGFYNLLIAIPTIIGVSFLFSKFIDKPIDRLRVRIKTKRLIRHTSP